MEEIIDPTQEEGRLPSSKGDIPTVGQNVTTLQGEQTVLSETDVKKMITDAIGNVDEKMQPIIGKIDKFEKSLVTDKASLMTVFGIFASVVTFLSVEIQFLKNVCDPLRLVGFSLVLLASLLSFVWMLHLLANFWINERVKDHPKLLVVFIVLLFGLGGTLLVLGKDEISCRDNYLFQKYNDDFNSRQIELEKKLSTGVNNLKQEVNIKLNKIESEISNMRVEETNPNNLDLKTN
jgi:hypothetical protein